MKRRVLLTVLGLCLVLGFSALGRWQLGREQVKRDQLAAAASQGASVRERMLSGFHWLFERDLSRPLLSGRMMAFAWTWSETQEERFQKSVQALTQRLVALLDDPERPTSEAAREAAAVALIAIYNVNLRRAVTAGYPAAEAMKRMAASFDVVLDGLAAASRDPQTKA